jgi:hypothetical protein
LEIRKCQDYLSGTYWTFVPYQVLHYKFNHFFFKTFIFILFHRKKPRQVTRKHREENPCGGGWGSGNKIPELRPEE